MNMEKNFAFARRYFVEFAAILAGLLLIVIGGYCGERFTAILIGIGCSLLASSTVSFFAAMFYARVGKAWQIISSWGLLDIFKTRQYMNARCDETFVPMTKNLDIMAWGLKSFRSSDKADQLPKKIKNGLVVRILAPSPDSPFTKQREKDEDQSEGSIRHSILALKEWADGLAKQNKDQNGNGSIEVRFYPFCPQDFYFRQDDYIYTGPYLYGIDSQQTISFEYGKPSFGFDLYARHFERVWDAAGKQPNNE